MRISRECLVWPYRGRDAPEPAGETPALRFASFRWRSLFHRVPGREKRIPDRFGAVGGDRGDAEPRHVEGDGGVVDGPDYWSEFFGEQAGDQRRGDGEAGVDAGQAVLLDQGDQVVFDVRLCDGAEAGAFVVEDLPTAVVVVGFEDDDEEAIVFGHLLLRKHDRVDVEADEDDLAGLAGLADDLGGGGDDLGAVLQFDEELAAVGHGIEDVFDQREACAGELLGFPAAGVEGAQLGGETVADGPTGVRGPVGGVVVDDDDLAVFREMYVELARPTDLPSLGEGGEGVLGRRVRLHESLSHAAMGDDLDDWFTH